MSDKSDHSYKSTTQRSKQRGCKGDLDANQKDWLSFASVRHQTSEAQRLECTEDENVSSVIKILYSR